MTIPLSSVCQLFDMTPRAVRHYEKLGLITPHRDALNRRCFDRETRKRLQLIAELRKASISLSQILEVLELEEEGEPAQLRRAAELIRSQLRTMDRRRQAAASSLDAIIAAAEPQRPQRTRAA